MNMLQPYSHPPAPWINEDGQLECRSCPRPLVGGGSSPLRHADEIIEPMRLDPAEAKAVRSAMEVIERALAEMWTDRCTDADRARVAAEALHRHGMVATRRPRARTRATAKRS